MHLLFCSSTTLALNQQFSYQMYGITCSAMFASLWLALCICAYLCRLFLSPHDLSLWYVSSLVLKPALAREAVADVSVRLPF